MPAKSRAPVARRGLAALLGMTLASVLSAPVSAGCGDVRDGFESGRLDPANWLEKQLYNNQIAVERTDMSEGIAARLFVEPGDRACGGSCQRNEIRIANHKRCLFGEDVWYRFRFRIEGTIPSPGSVRWVIGQWKQESGGSPFLAQRFDNGVFHITVQHNRNRVLVTKAEGNPNARGDGRPDQVGFMDHTRRIRLASLGRSETGPVNPRVDRRPFEVFMFRDTTTGTSGTDIRVELGADPVLPDPQTDWVDMTYRVRGGRDGNGLIEIWANGVFKARVTGTIGNHDSVGPTQYFKFGHYRDIHPTFGTASYYFDDFVRSRDRAAVFGPSGE
ncbi:MAG: heparin lyase I family protein [Pseudomonadota bacterium]